MLGRDGVLISSSCSFLAHVSPPGPKQLRPLSDRSQHACTALGQLPGRTGPRTVSRLRARASQRARPSRRCARRRCATSRRARRRQVDPAARCSGPASRGASSALLRLPPPSAAAYISAPLAEPHMGHRYRHARSTGLGRATAPGVLPLRRGAARPQLDLRAPALPPGLVRRRERTRARWDALINGIKELDRRARSRRAPQKELEREVRAREVRAGEVVQDERTRFLFSLRRSRYSRHVHCHLCCKLRDREVERETSYSQGEREGRRGERNGRGGTQAGRTGCGEKGTPRIAQRKMGRTSSREKGAAHAGHLRWRLARRASAHSRQKVWPQRERATCLKRMLHVEHRSMRCKR